MSSVAGRIHGRNHLVGSGQMNQPERIEELELRRAKHERVTRGKPAKAFGELLDEKLRKRSSKDSRRDRGGGEEDHEEEAKDGAIDPLLGLVPGQSTEIANPSGGRRSGKVIVKG